MKTDSRDRRSRFASPNPTQGRIVLIPADYPIFEAINRHGPLPTHYLFEYVRDVRKNYARFQNRLTALYNGDKDGPYLTRPAQQFAQFNAHARHLVYGLAPRARELLDDATSPTASAWFVHQLMQACVGSTLELTAPLKGLRYVSRQEVLGGASGSLVIPGFEPRTLIPDDVFALENGEGKKRYFIIEIDRATESMDPRGEDRNALGKKTTYFSKKLTSYVDAFRLGVFRKDWSILRPHILIVTTSGRRVRQITEAIKALNEPSYEHLFAVACEPCFGPNWRVPPTLLSHLLDQPWDTATGERNIIDP